MMVHLKKGCTKGCTTKKIVIRKNLADKGFSWNTQHSDPYPSKNVLEALLFACKYRAFLFVRRAWRAAL